MNVGDWFSGQCFNLVHRHNLVYNTCWEDPRLDRVALELGPDDNLLMITSAGCNALDYALCGPKHIYAVDMNPRQNALLELKMAGIKKLDFETFFSLFGKGRLNDFRSAYHDTLRESLSPISRAYWDRHTDYFDGSGWRPTFYFHGTSGLFARLINFYIDRVAKVRDAVTAIFAANTVDEQRHIYDSWLRDAFWKRFIRWAVGRDTTLSLLGVPRPQRQQVEKDYVGGIAKFIEDSIESVFACLPIGDNYFWRVYVHGEYTRECCPEYLKQENFEKLKGGLVDHVSAHTCSVLDFLMRYEGKISRYVLLDHMDWLSTMHFPILEQEWQSIVDRAAPNARILWRSGGLRSDFIDRVEVLANGQRRQVGSLLQYNRDLAAELHVKDRVHTYGSFYITNLAYA